MTTPDRRINAAFLADIEAVAKEKDDDMLRYVCAELRLTQAERDEARGLLDAMRENEVEEANA